MILYAIGDSLMYGMECLGHKDRSPENKNYSFAKCLADKLGCTEYINNSYNGAPNDFIFRKSIEDLIELENSGKNPADIFVLIGWSALARNEIDGSEIYNKLQQSVPVKVFDDKDSPFPEFNDFGTFFINPGFQMKYEYAGKTITPANDVLKFLSLYFWSNKTLIPQQISRLIALHEFLKSKGYRHVFVNTCGDHDYQLPIKTPINFYNQGKESFQKWGLERFPNEVRLENHFSPKPHKEYADRLLKYINTNSI